MRRAWLVGGRVNPFPPSRATAIGRRWRQSRDVLPPTERIKFEWTTAVCSNGALVAFAVFIKSVLSYRRARGPRMDMKKRIHLELRNRTPSDVSPSLLASRPALAPRTRLMENLSVWWSCRGDFLQSLPATWEAIRGACVGSHRGGRVDGRRGAAVATFVWFQRRAGSYGLSVAPRLNARGIHKASGVRSHICNFFLFTPPPRLNPNRFIF